MKLSLAFLAGLSVAAAACGRESPPRPAVASLQPVEVEHGAAYERVMEATACWMGGLWGDALGESAGVRPATIERRCDEFLAGNAEPQESYYPLRALDRATVDRLASKIDVAAQQDLRDSAHAAQLVTLFRATADAARETVDARRAADTVKDDAAGQPDVSVRNVDKQAAADELGAFRACRGLLRLDVPAYAAEARGAGLLFAVGRMEIARGLPKHLKIVALRGAFAELFAVPPPALPADPASPIPTGTWLLYLSDAAAAAGHPLPADAHDPQNQEPLAWNGVLEGFADVLATSAVRMPPGNRLGDVERALVARLDEQYVSARVAFEAHAPQDR